MLRQLGLIFLLGTLSPLASAETDIRYYDVEFILFEHTNSQNRQSEDWNARRLPAESEQAELSHVLGLPYVLEAESPYDRDATFIELPDSEKKLLEEAKLITESGSRRVLAHVAWRQPGLAREQAVWVQFKKMVPADEQNSTVAPVSTETKSIDFLTGRETFNPYVEGKVKVMLARYLHVDTDILYFASPLPQPVSEDINIEQAQENEPEVFLLKQLRRRIRSKELHYLDHPVMSMMLTITPYEKPEEAEQATNKPAGYKTLQ